MGPENSSDIQEDELFEHHKITASKGQEPLRY